MLNQLQAACGGGDYPEAMNEALHETVHSLSWRGTNTTRMVFLIADAPPHLDYGGPQYDDDMVAALGKGIKIFSVWAPAGWTNRANTSSARWRSTPAASLCF